MIKKIKIFIASSIEELKADRTEIGDFFRQLNEIYLDRGIHFSLIKCEDYDDSVALSGKQSQYDEEIRDSAISFFLFFKKVGDFTKHEFEVALESYKEKKSPRIVTYFKYINEGEDAGEEVKSFMNMLSSELNHYYNKYGNIDTLKLGMLMQIKLLNLDSAELKIESGSVTVSGKELAKCENIPMFSGNVHLKSLKEELSKAQATYFELKLKAAEDASLYEKYIAAAGEVSRIEKEIEDIEEKTLSAAEYMHKASIEGVMSERQAAACRALESGDIDAALAFLDKGEILADLEKGEDIATYGKEKIQASVYELLQRAKLVIMKNRSKEAFEEYEELYKKACEKTLEFNLKIEVLYDFAYYFLKQYKHKQAIYWMEKLKLKAELDDMRGIPVSRVYTLYANALLNTGNVEEGQKAFERALQILNSEPKSAERDEEIATVNVGLANIAHYKTDYKTALEMTEKSAAIFEKYADDENYNKAGKYISCLTNIAIYNWELGNTQEANKFFGKAHKILKKFLEKMNNLDAVCSSVQLGIDFGKFLVEYSKDMTDDALGLLTPSIKMLELVKNVNPRRVEPVLAKAYVQCGKLQKDIGEKIKNIENGIKILARYYGGNTAGFCSKYAESYRELATAYVMKGGKESYDKAVSATLKSLKALEKHFDESSVNKVRELGITYDLMAHLMLLTNQKKQAIPYYTKAIELYKKNKERDRISKERYDIATAGYENLKKQLNQPKKAGNAQNNQNKNQNQKAQNKPLSAEAKKAEQEYMRGEKLFGKGNSAEAEKAFKGALSLCQNCKRSEATNIIAYCNYRLAIICENSGRHDVALKHCALMHQSIKEAGETLPESECAVMLTGYGTLLARAGRKQDASAIYLDAIKAYETANKKDGKDYFSEMGTIYDYVTVMAAEERAWKDAIMVGMLAVHNHGNCSDNVKRREKQANSYRNLAYIYECKGDKDMAENSHICAINNYKWLSQNKGGNYVNMMMETFNSLITFYKKNPASLKKVESAYLDMIEVFEKLCQKDFKGYGETLASLYESISNVVVGLFNLKKVREYKGKAKEIRAKLLKS